MRIARFILLFGLAVGILAIPAPSHAQVAVGVSIRIGPPALPVYAQPICPGPGYIWTPGYWAYGPDGYFWVPGTWVLAPEPGFLWTPGYWGLAEGVYVWHGGYWGPHVGFYGGINYGFGYTGVGFVGGYWRGGNYFYNRSVTNVNVTNIHNTYNTTVVNNTTINRTSFNGGPGGIHAEPNRDERRFEHERHVSMTAEQNRHLEGARGDRRFLASENHGRPEVAATPHSGDFHGRDVEHGRADDRARPDDRGRSDRPPSARHSDNPSSNPRLEQKHEQQFDKMQRQHDAQRQKMQQRHDQEQQKQSRQNANQQRQDQLQRRQQQQTEQMNRKQQQQTQKLQQRQEREHQNEQSKPHGNGNRP